MSDEWRLQVSRGHFNHCISRSVFFKKYISGLIFKQRMKKQTSIQCKQQSKCKAVPITSENIPSCFGEPDIFLSTVITIYYLAMNQHQSIQNKYFRHKSAISTLVCHPQKEIFSTVIILTAAGWNYEIELVSNTDHLNKRRSYKFILTGSNSWTCLKILPSPPGIIHALEILCHITAVL